MFVSARALGVIGLGGLVLLAISTGFGCSDAAGPGGTTGDGASVIVASAPVATSSVSAPTPVSEPRDERYFRVVRPLLSKHGCDAGPCHGTFKGGGFHIAGGLESLADYRDVLAQIDREHPAASKLLVKAFGQVQHNGGKNLDPAECDAQRIVAWIAAQPDPACASPSPSSADRLARFTREVVPALKRLGCASGACHGADRAAIAKLDLASIAGNSAPPRPGLRPPSASAASAAEPPEAPALAAIERTWLNKVVPWMSPVLKAAWGEGSGKHRKVDVASCAYARLHGFVAGAPESTCDLRARVSPSVVADFTATVMPSLSKRGCTEASCHGGAAGGLALFVADKDPHAPIHDLVVLRARIEAGRAAAETTLVRKVRNADPHGGGQRLGGEGDCRDAMLLTFIEGKPVKPCLPRRAPSAARFATEVQPVLEQMTCTRAACHGSGTRRFHVTAHPDAAALEGNYQETLAEIDLEFTPLSEVMLRMREPCAYATVTAWIEDAPKPACVVHDPDPKIFPRLDDASPMHPSPESL